MWDGSKWVEMERSRKNKKDGNSTCLHSNIIAMNWEGEIDLKQVEMDRPFEKAEKECNATCWGGHIIEVRWERTGSRWPDHPGGPARSDQESYKSMLGTKPNVFEPILSLTFTWCVSFLFLAKWQGFALIWIAVDVKDMMSWEAQLYFVFWYLLCQTKTQTNRHCLLCC